MPDCISRFPREAATRRIVERLRLLAGLFESVGRRGSRARPAPNVKLGDKLRHGKDDTKIGFGRIGL